MIHHNTILPVTLFSFSNFFRFFSFFGRTGTRTDATSLPVDNSNVPISI